MPICNITPLSNWLHIAVYNSVQMQNDYMFKLQFPSLTISSLFDYAISSGAFKLHSNLLAFDMSSHMWNANALNFYLLFSISNISIFQCHTVCSGLTIFLYFLFSFADNDNLVDTRDPLRTNSAALCDISSFYQRRLQLLSGCELFVANRDREKTWNSGCTKCNVIRISFVKTQEKFCTFETFRLYFPLLGDEEEKNERVLGFVYWKMIHVLQS